MSGDRDELSLFGGLVELDADARASRLAIIGEQDAALAERLRDLLRAHDRPLLEAPAVIEPPDPLPATVGGYRVLERLGQGGMGNVYLCEQTEPVRRKVAVKVLRAGMDTRDVIARFDAERQALALMTHSNIARILDAGASAEDRPYFVMEYVPGMPLMRYCREKALDLRQRLALFMQVCAAVQHAHQKGVIHRDIKPSNILVMEIDGNAVPKIIDFGIAKATGAQLTGRTLHTLHGNLVGTPEYMSPEQADIGAVDVDTRADIYSLGVVLYELLTDTVPFDFSKPVISLNSIQRTLRTEAVQPPSRKVAAVGGEGKAQRLKGDLDWITLKALEKDRARRYASAAEFAADIGRHLADLPVSAVRPGSLYVLGKFVRRHAAATAGTALLSFMLLLFSIYTNFQANALAAERDRANYQATKSRQVTEFLIGLFASGDPQSGYSPDLTVREAMEIGLRRTGTALPAQPEVRNVLLYTISRVYNALGLYVDAEKILRDVLRGAASDAALQRDANVQLAHALVALDKFEQAEATLQPIVAAADGDDRTGLEAQLLLGQLYRERGRLEDADAIFQRVIAHVNGQPAFDDLKGLALLGLGNTLLEASRIDEAAAPLAEAYRLIVGTRGADHADSIDARNAVAYQLTMQGSYEQALPYYEESLRSALRIFGENHHSIALAWNDLGMIRMYLDDYAGAEPAFLRALEIHTRVHGKTHSETLRAMSNLAGVYGASGKIDKAAPLFDEALAARTELFGPDSEEVARTRMNYGFALNVARDFAGAEREFRRALSSFERLHGRDHWLYRSAQNGLGEALIGQRQFAAAETEVCDAYRALTAMFDADHPRTQYSRELAADLYREWRAADPERAKGECE